MKRVEVKLSLAVVAPLLDVIKYAADSLGTRLAASLDLGDEDPDLQDAWRDDLLTSQNEDLKTFLALFDKEFFSTGVVSFDEDNGDAIVRASAAVRLQLRQQYLKALPDEELESGDVAIDELEEPVKRAFMCYLFLATVQELIIQHLDPDSPAEE